MRVFDTGDLRVAMKEGGTWTFNPDCCTLLSEEAAAAAAADTNDAVDLSSDDEDGDGVQITRMSAYTHAHTSLLRTGSGLVMHPDSFVDFSDHKSYICLLNFLSYLLPSYQKGGHG